jgi:cell wall-associated NlpC family hydrolase
MSETRAPDARVNAFRPDLADAALEGHVAAERFLLGETFRVIAASAPLRKSADDDAMMVTEALFGESLRVFDRTDEGWAWAQLVADRYVGWMRADALSLEPTAEPTHKVAALRTFAFSRPDIKSRPLSGLPFGSRVAVTGAATDRNASYALIAPAGAVVEQHLAPLAAFEPDFVAVAERFVGVPYLWGGKTSFGIDCSGLVQIALDACGIAAPRDSDMQEAAVGSLLPPDGGLRGLRRGDLVFWPSHVGIMQDETMLLHANGHQMAVVSEPLSEMIARVEPRGLRITSVRRIMAR